MIELATFLEGMSCGLGSDYEMRKDPEGQMRTKPNASDSLLDAAFWLRKASAEFAGKEGKK